MRSAVIFDLDGTLLDTLEDLTVSTNAALSAYGLPARTKSEVRRFVGNGAERLICLALPGKPDDPPVSQVLAAFRAHYNVHCLDRTAPYPGILEALRHLPVPMAIVSNKPDSAVKSLCARFFPGVPAFGETDGCPRKPAPDMVFRAMASLDATQCVYVGDSEVDIETARNAGAVCLSVLWGFRDREELLSAGGTHFCERPENLEHCIGEILDL